LVSEGVEFVLVAGQACSFWGGYFSDNLEVSQFAPFLSKDLDILSKNSELPKIRRTMVELTEYRWDRGQPMFAAGHLADGSRVDFLLYVKGVSPEEVFDHAIQVEYQGFAFRVIDPITLFVAKAHNVVELDQEDRHDGNQLRMLAHAINSYFAEMLSVIGQTDLSERAVIIAMRKLIQSLSLRQVEKACLTLRIHPVTLFPIEQLRQYSKLQRFLEGTLQPWLDLRSSTQA